MILLHGRAPFWATTLAACRRNSYPGRGELLMVGALAKLADRVIPDLCEPGSEENGYDRWTAELKRKDFGITPISLRRHGQ